MDVTQIRPILTLDSKIGEMPRDWAIHIEPFLIRQGYLPCWMWIKAGDKDDYPVFRLPLPGQRHGQKVLVRRWIASMFWQFPKQSMVVGTCGNRRCLNPGHMYVTNGVHARNSLVKGKMEKLYKSINKREALILPHHKNVLAEIDNAGR